MQQASSVARVQLPTKSHVAPVRPTSSAVSHVVHAALDGVDANSAPAAQSRRSELLSQITPLLQ
jgi:hypothetical protein